MSTRRSWYKSRNTWSKL